MNINRINIFPQGEKVLIAGPCSAESEQQVMAIAGELAAQGVTLFRAGLWKPRTRPGCFEGVGSEGLQWLAAVKKEYSLPVSTEVATPAHVEEALKAGVDVLWVGARTTTNPFAVQHLADALRGVDVPVLVKNPVNPDLELWIGALERLYNSGVTRLGAIHRGFSSYGEKIFRNSPQWQIPLELKNRLPEIPLLCDPSHIGGNKDYIMLLSQQAMDLNLDGLMIEVHNNPQCALSDAQQQVTPARLAEIMESLVRRSVASDSAAIAPYREQLDSIDSELLRLLSKRMEIAREIGRIKKEKGLTVFQPFRYKEIMERYSSLSSSNSIDADAAKNLFEAIHSESIRQQLLIVNEK